jgi:GTP cyclohydrolase II
MELAQAMIEQQGAGVIIWLDQDGRGNGHLALVRSRALQEQGLSQTEAYVQLGYAADARQYTSAAAILQELGVRSVVLMTNSPRKIDALQAAGMPIVGTRTLALDPGTDAKLRRFYEDKIAQGHRIALSPTET